MSVRFKRDWVSATVVISLLIAVAFAQNQPAASTQTQKLTDFFFYKCQNQTKGTAAFDKLYADAVQFKDFLQYTFLYLPDKTSTFCKSERGNLERRVSELAIDVKPCLANEEKYLSDFMRDSFKEFLHFLCHHDGEYVTKFFSPSANQCRTALENDQTNQVGMCFSRIFKPSSGTIKKKEVCDDLTTAEKCFVEILDRQCPSYASYKLLNKKLFEYIRKPCSGCVFTLSTSMLVASVLFSYLFSH